MTRRGRPAALAVVLAGVSATGCREHPSAAVELTADACVACHRADYDIAPDHPGRYPERCDDCHRDEAWRPALEFGHPDVDFPIGEGAHAGFACIDCHEPERGPSADGSNTDCVGCHTGDHGEAISAAQHAEVPDYAFEPEAPAFCLACHPRGRRE